MEQHISRHPNHTSPMRSLQGKITAIYPKDNIYNKSQAFTLYQVEVYKLHPSTTETLGPIRVAGQECGGVSDQTDTLELGTPVLIEFIDGDANLPIISKVLPSFDTTIAPLEAVLPISKIGRRGAYVEVDKDGNGIVTLADEKSFKIVDESGAELMEIYFSGGDYKMKLMNGTDALIKATHLAWANAHIHPDPVSGVTGPPTVTSPSSNLTTKVTAT